MVSPNDVGTCIATTAMNKGSMLGLCGDWGNIPTNYGRRIIWVYNILQLTLVVLLDQY